MKKLIMLCAVMAIAVLASCTPLDSEDVNPFEPTISITDNPGDVEGEDDPCVGGC